MTSRPMRRQRGTSLVEAIVAAALLGGGLIGAAALQGSLRLSTEAARHRTEASRLAQREAERLRGYTTLASTPAQRAYDDLAASPAAPMQDVVSANTTYTLATRIDRHATTGSAATAVSVAWQDRRGAPRQLELRGLLAGVDPALAGLLALRPHATPTRPALGRHAGVPLGAHDLGDGRSVFKPQGRHGTVAWVLDNATGVVTARCEVAPGLDAGQLSAALLTGCTSGSGRVVTGTVRFATAGPVSAADADDPIGSPALDLDMALDGAECHDDAPAAPAVAQPLVSYACRIAASPWSGRLLVTPVGWGYGTTRDTYRLCRYSAEADGRPGITGAEHPRDYVDVTTSLAQQNFLVIRGDAACPTDTPADPARGDFVDASTVELAPRAVPDPLS